MSVERRMTKPPAAANSVSSGTPTAMPGSPVHWPYRFPEVFRQGRFDAVVGNPPFLGGQKLTGTLGKALPRVLGHRYRTIGTGSADLVAYFLLRAHELLNECGQTGLIATNTLAQGDTREVGLDQLRRQKAWSAAGGEERAVAVAECDVGVLRGVDEPRRRSGRKGYVSRTGWRSRGSRRRWIRCRA